MTRLPLSASLLAVFAALVLALLPVSAPRASAAPVSVDSTSCGGDLDNHPIPNDFCTFAEGASAADIVIGPNSCNEDHSCFTLPNGATINAGGDPGSPGSCNGEDVCESALGPIDGGSCIDESACERVGPVSAGSCIGDYSCHEAVGPIGPGSCLGPHACDDARGSVGAGSCDGDNACILVDGNVGKGSCNGDNACNRAAGPIGNGSCNGDSACDGAEVAVGDCEANNEGYGCAGLTLRKFLFPSYDSGRFDLLIDGEVEAAAVGHNGSTGAVEVPYGGREVSEAAVSPAVASNYRTTIVCQDTASRAIVGYAYTTSLTVEVAPDSDVVCTFVNQRLRTWFWWR
jgi:hypothetical protein